MQTERKTTRDFKHKNYNNKKKKEKKEIFLLSLSKNRELNLVSQETSATAETATDRVHSTRLHASGRCGRCLAARLASRIVTIVARPQRSWPRAHSRSAARRCLWWTTRGHFGQRVPLFTRVRCRGCCRAHHRASLVRILTSATSIIQIASWPRCCCCCCCRLWHALEFVRDWFAAAAAWLLLSRDYGRARVFLLYIRISFVFFFIK